MKSHQVASTHANFDKNQSSINEMSVDNKLNDLDVKNVGSVPYNASQSMIQKNVNMPVIKENDEESSLEKL